MKSLIRSILIFFLILCSMRIAAQELARPFALDPSIGDTLTAAKRAELVLLPNIVDFEKAVFYLNPDSSLRMRVFMLRDGVRRDSVIARYHDVAWMRNRIASVVVAQTGSTDPPEDPALVQDRQLRSGSGANAIIRLHNDQVVEGELLAVRDSSVVLNISGERGKPVLLETDILILQYPQMKRVDFPNLHPELNSFALTIIGASAGAALGYWWASSLTDPPDFTSRRGPQGPGHAESAMGVGIYGGAIVGGIIGLIVGNSLYHESCTEIRDCFPKFKPYARYPDGDPEYLKRL